MLPYRALIATAAASGGAGAPTSGAGALSLDDLALTRRLALRDALARQQSAGSSDGKPARADAAGGRGAAALDWPLFAGARAGAVDSAARDIKTRFQTFIGQVAAAVGSDGSAAAPAVREAALAIYVVGAREAARGWASLSRAPDRASAAAAAAARLAAHISCSVPPQELAAMFDIIAILHAWRVAHGIVPELTVEGARPAAAASGRAAPASATVSLAWSTGVAAPTGGSAEPPFTPLRGWGACLLPQSPVWGAASTSDAAAPPSPLTLAEVEVRRLLAAAAEAAAEASDDDSEGDAGAAATTTPAGGTTLRRIGRTAETDGAVLTALMGTVSATPSIDAIWLYAQCAQFVAMSRAAAGEAGATLTAEAVGVNILELMHARRGSESEAEARLQTALFDLLGADHMDFLQACVRHRAALAAVSTSDFRRVAAALDSVQEGRYSAARRGGGATGGGAGFTPAVTVIRAADVQAAKERQREGRKAARHAKTLHEVQARLSAEVAAVASGGDASTINALVAAGFDPAYLAVERGLGLGKDRHAAAAGAGAGAGAAGARGRGVAAPAGGRISVDAAIAAVGAGFGGGQKRALPEGTVELAREGYTEFVVPPPSASRRGDDASRLIAVADMDPIAQEAFRGIARLNRLQSELFDAAYNSNENLLVCAPTGAGKTNVAMLAVCHEVLSHVTPDGRLRKDDFKIIYVAPMKALAQEVVAKFSQRLSTLGIAVRELTGDMQLTKREIAETQIIVTTPEKWDVITRKAGDGSLVSQVKLLIIDEVHLLADDRGAVIESLVARTLRLVESTQSVIRIVGLSATLPNYQDVALFLRVNPSSGLFHFDASYRPVPLQQAFIGLTEPNHFRRLAMMNRVAYERALAAIRRGKQVMVFVHSRKDTANTARALADHARSEGTIALLTAALTGASPTPATATATGATTSTIQGEGRLALTPAQLLALQREVEKSRNKDVKDLFTLGFGIHHAGMLRSDRGLTERLFAAGIVKVLVCTATLAWGVNLPAHTVIIKGTQIYDAEAGGFADLGMLDVMQIFGRAGRPQFDTSGEGIIITSHDKLQHYLQLLMHTMPIESSFIKSLPDHLNAEVVSGTVTNIREAVSWLSYTYLYIRMLRNPIAYGVGWEEQASDPMLEVRRVKLITDAAKRLDVCHMIRFDERSGNLAVTDLGRVASHFYISNGSMETFNGVLDASPSLTDAGVLDLICRADEFKNIKVRDEELAELDALKVRCHLKFKGDVANTVAKVNVLMQAYISREQVRGFTLISDTAYITQSAGRIARALFEISLRKGWCTLAERLLAVSKSLDKRLWWDVSPLWQLADMALTPEMVAKLEASGEHLDELCAMGAPELGALVRHPNMGRTIQQALSRLPFLEVEPSVQPITRGILRVTLRVTPTFSWLDRMHGASEPWYLWIEDAANERIYHHEYLLVTKRQATVGETTTLTFSIPIFEPLPPQYWVRAVSDRWLGMETVVPISFKHLVLPERHPPHTNLLDLTPLPVSALRNPAYEALYTRFSHFNPVQTQVFHTLYHADTNVLLGAPTGSGKTVAAELAVFRLLNAHPGSKAVYIAPLKALVSERMKDWRAKFGGAVSPGLRRRIVELTGDVTPDMRALQEADIIVTTPEKWDGISRSWQRRSYVQKVGVIIIDEIHLLGEDRGPVLEVIVSRMRYIASRTARPIRFVGLSTALANARDLADWLGIDTVGLYNFRPSVRPIPMEVHIQGFPGKHYCLAEDMQILTEKGFMFLDELLAVRAREPGLLVAAYDDVAKTFSYVAPSDVIVNPAAEQQMIELTHGEEARRWGSASDAYGGVGGTGSKRRRSGDDDAGGAGAGAGGAGGVAAEDEDEAIGSRGPARAQNYNGISMLVTPDHDMFVRRGKCSGADYHTRWQDTSYSKIKARDLVGMAAVKTLGRAQNGFAPAGPEETPPYIEKLGITAEREPVFLELFGYWLGNGALAVEPTKYVVFNVAKKHDIAFLRESLEELGLKYVECAPTGAAGQVQIKFCEPAWVDFFFEEYGHTCGKGRRSSWANTTEDAADAAAASVDERPCDRESSAAASHMEDEEIKSGKWIPQWLWRRGYVNMRAVVAGLRRADGEEAAGTGIIYTSSRRFRDELVRLCVHAGYAATFSCEYRAGADRGIDRGGRNIIANHDSWRVIYQDDSRWAGPTLDGERGDIIKAVDYEGRTWCVTVPTGLIIVRRAGVDATGQVTKVSLTQVVGNCPRMASMNKPAFAAIATYSPDQPVLIFVASRRQTRLTALELIALCATDDNPKRFLRMPDEEMAALCAGVKDTALKHTLAFGIGIHHAGLCETDRTLVEELYVSVKIQVLVCTATLAWGVNFPAHLVIVKGTEFFDCKLGRYVDFAITDVLQMMGRAGRPQFDTHGVAVILAHEPKKNFYRKFLYEPFPVESQLKDQLADHLNAEVAGGTIASRHDAVEYLTWTYLFRRLMQNPSYYGLEDTTTAGIKAYLYSLVDGAFAQLEASGTVALGEEAVESLTADAAAAPASAAPRTLPTPEHAVAATTLGLVASYYYLSHKTVGLFASALRPDLSIVDLAELMCNATEFAELPVRHNEDELNASMAEGLPWPVPPGASFLSPHVKAFLLLQARFAHAPLPISDYINDTKALMDQAMRVLNALIDIAAEAGMLEVALRGMHLLQCITAACFPDDSTLVQLRGATDAAVTQVDRELRASPTGAALPADVAPSIPMLMALPDATLASMLRRCHSLAPAQVASIISHVRGIPDLDISWRPAGGAGAATAATASTPQPTVTAAAGASEVAIEFKLTVANAATASKQAITPFYTKRKEWGWWLVVGREDAGGGELLALKKCSMTHATSTHTLQVAVPEGAGPHALHVYLISDAMRGIDQQYPLRLHLAPALAAGAGKSV